MKTTILKFLKNRFPIAVIALISFSKITTLNMKQSILIIIVLTGSLLIYSFLHELGHAIIATILGFKVNKLTLQRVYVEDEPTTFEEISESKDRLKYGMIAMSGTLMTIVFGYILLYITHNLRYGMELISFLCWYFILIIFLIGDCGYLILGSLLMNGDPVGISAGFGISRWIIFSIGVILLVINIMLIRNFFWIVT